MRLSAWPTLVRIMIGRLAMLMVVLAVLLVRLPGDAMAVYAVVSLAFVVHIPYALWLRNENTTRVSTPLQFVVDVFVITGIVHFTGGIASELFLLYPLVILSAGIVASPAHSLKVALLSVVLYSTLVVLEMNGVIPYYGKDAAAYAETGGVVQSLVGRVVVFMVFSVVGHFLSKRCSYQAEKLRAYQDWVMAVFDNVSVGIITVTDDHTVLFVNRSAADMLEASPESLAGKPLGELFGERVPSLSNASLDAEPMWKMQCGNKRIPVAFSVSKASFPMVRAWDAAHANNESEVSILVIRDLTKELEMEENRRQIERLTTASQVGFELAHYIRNPLTAIQCGCTGIQGVVHTLKPSDLEACERDKVLLEYLVGIIGTEANRVGQELENFLFLSTNDPKTLMKSASAAAEQFKLVSSLLPPDQEPPPPSPPRSASCQDSA